MVQGQRKRLVINARKNVISGAVQDCKSGSLYVTAAQQQGLAISSLWHCDHGYKSLAEAHKPFQKLSAIEKQEMRDWLKGLDDFGIHVTHKIIIACANDILAERGSNETVRKTWIWKYMMHFPKLKTAPSEKKEVVQSPAKRDPVRLEKFSGL
ncbi:hypothetical protein BT96DRAFT_946124 [Gymnopus androsaceus JB14]|uniref:HTH CENPB-type domain-containing protein n=1 Tax=Gymnopus androsaceus JB14 TaxID=1447944 RepID=A0A6A4GY81_9AGAR|nr:hypothetical protein BT96DRAFT_946124 [Gymnopus androsaceus JB14]